jgi:hypothetical protein
LLLCFLSSLHFFIIGVQFFFFCRPLFHPSEKLPADLPTRKNGNLMNLDTSHHPSPPT